MIDSVVRIISISETTFFSHESRLSLLVCGHCKQGQSFTEQHAAPLLWR
jgi:hypothetical protein